MTPKVEFSTTYAKLGSIGTVSISKSCCTATCTARGNYWIGTFVEDGGSESAQVSMVQGTLVMMAKEGPSFIPPSI